MKAAICLLPLVLAACGSKSTVTAENASAEEVAAKVKAAGADGQINLNPGHWDSTVTLDRINVPGMSPEATANMKKVMAGKVSGSCLTPEEAKKPAAEFFGGKDRKDCRYDHFEMGKGKIDARMTCSQSGQTAAITMQGTYQPEAFRLAMTTEVTGAAKPGASMSMAATIDSKRTGPCTGKDTEPKGS